jgi:hypothetical protein
VKAVATLAGVSLAANTTITWRFQTGAEPYVTQLEVHKSQWSKLEGKQGDPQILRLADSAGVEKQIKEVYILHQVPSGSPNRVRFLVADRRWRWANKLVVRDFNVPRKSGTLTAFQAVPAANLVTVDEYTFKRYSLFNGVEKWTPRTAIEDVLTFLEADDDGNAPVVIDSLPIDEQGSQGSFSIQNLTLRDPGNAAVARLLAYIPGAEVWIDQEGTIRVFDGTDIEAARSLLEELKPETWSGVKVEEIDRKPVRPSKVNVWFTRELEVGFEYEDDYGGGTAVQQDRNRPFLINVLPTVDVETTVFQYDAEGNVTSERKVPPGTWVEVSAWLDAMDKVKPKGSMPWKWDTIKRHWVAGDLEGVLGGRELDREKQANVMLRVQALRRHFRQTFQLSNRYYDRVRDIRSVRVGVLDPVTGARGTAGVWGQSCVIPSTKGRAIMSRRDGSAAIYRNADYYPTAGKPLDESTPSPARAQIVEKDLGIFRVDWGVSPYGDEASIIPCLTVGANGQTPTEPEADLRTQTTAATSGYTVRGGPGSIFLANRLRMRVILTIVPAAPNNERQLERVQLDGGEIAEEFRTELGLAEGKGPELDVFVPPSEVTARYAWQSDNEAIGTIGALLGLGNEDPTKAGIDPGIELDGYLFVNKAEEVDSYAAAAAVQALVAYADAPQGTVVGRMPEVTELKGNIRSAAVSLSAAPSAVMQMVTEFPGRQKALSRYAFLPEGARKSILGIVTFKE